MAKDKDGNLKTSNLRKMLEEEAANQKESQREKEFREKLRLGREAAQRATEKEISKTDRDAEVELKKLKKQMQQHEENPPNIHIQSYASMMMSLAPEVSSLVKFILGKTKVKERQFGNAVYKGFILPLVPREKLNKLFHNAGKYLFGKEPVTIPSLQYFVTVDDEGYLSKINWNPESFGKLFHDESGDYIEEAAQAVQNEIESSFREWVESVADEESEDGYFVGFNEGTEEHPLYRVYPKSVGQQLPGGRWVLDEGILRANYGEDQIHEVSGVFVPKKGEQPIEGRIKLYIDKEGFERLRATENQSLGSFLENKYSDVMIDHNDKPSPRLG